MVIEKEFLVVIHAINKFRHYIIGYFVIFYTDHLVIKYLMNKAMKKNRVTRWFLLLQEFDITILYKPRKDNVMASFLSRITSNENEPMIEDHFLDEHLFTVSTNSHWFVDIANFLATGKLPHHLTPNEQQSIVRKSERFSWIDGFLFYNGPDLIIIRCVREDKVHEILKSCQNGPCGGHFADKRTGYKILHQGYY
jgi:hypothetical protein